MRILFLNCYDKKNPKSGGAEIFTHEFAKRLVKDGHIVDWISAKFEKSSGHEVVDGINIHRFSNRIFVLFYAAWFYFQNKKQIDIVIDQFHAYPFFARFYVPEKKLLLIIHEIADTIWDYMIFFPISAIGKLIERIAISYIYRNVQFITISNSTKQDLIALGIEDANIKIVPEGLEKKKINYKNIIKKDFQLICASGIRKMKRIEAQIDTIDILRKDFPQIRLVITGRTDGKYFQKLQKLIASKGLKKFIRFTGFIEKKQLDKLVAESYLMIGTSVKEGWGLAISEAARLGTPSVCYNVPGYRDSVKHYETGLLTIENTPEKLALAIRRLFLDKKLYAKLQKGGILYTEDMDWDLSYEAFKRIIRLGSRS